MPPLRQDAILRKGHRLTDPLCQSVVQWNVTTVRVRMLNDYEGLVSSGRRGRQQLDDRLEVPGRGGYDHDRKRLHSTLTKSLDYAAERQRARAPDPLMILLPPNPVGTLANTTAALPVYASAPTHGELRHSISDRPFHCCGLTASNRTPWQTRHFGRNRAHNRT